MKKKLFLSVALAVAVFPALNANAGVLAEPVLGYTWGQEVDLPGTSEGGQGLSYGGRLGWQAGDWQFGADYLKNDIEMDDNDFDDNVETDEWAAFVGYEFPILFRVYGGYIFSAEGETKVNGVDVDLEDGSGYKLGVGFTGLPIVDINLEYRNGTFDEVKSGGVDRDEADFNAYMISVSAPFEFFD